MVSRTRRIRIRAKNIKFMTKIRTGGDPLKKQNCYLMQYVTKSCLLAVFASKDTTKWITLNLLLQYVDTNLENLALRRALSRRKIVQTAIKLSKKRIFSSLMTRFCNKKLSGYISMHFSILYLFCRAYLHWKLSITTIRPYPAAS